MSRMLGTAAVLLAALAGCGPGDVDIVLSGTVSYDRYSAGTIRLIVAEGETQDCGPFSCTVQTPGRSVARLDLERPGEFSIHATVQDGDSRSAVELMAYALAESTEIWNCEAGTSVSLPATSHRDLALVLEPGLCPMRE